MPNILIVDACKPSLVMSSEVFKDKIAGANILVAITGKQALDLLAAEKIDMCVADFDLPDTDGVTLIHTMRKTYKGPILLTAYPDSIVDEAVKSDLFAWGDAGTWIPKPVKFDTLSEKIDQYLLDKHRLGRRFDTHLKTLIIGKGAGRGKRAPKTTGRVINISLGGACIELDTPLQLEGGEEMFMALDLPGDASAPGKSGRSATSSARKNVTAAECRIRCVIAWVDKKHTKAGVQFSRLSDIQRKGLEELLRGTAPDSQT